MTTKTKKIRYWAAISHRGKVGTAAKRTDAMLALSAADAKFDATTDAYKVHKFEHEVEVPEKKVKKSKATSRNGTKPKAKKRADKKAKAKKAKKKAKKAKAAPAPPPPSMPW